MVFCNKAHGSDRNLGKDTGSLSGAKESTVAPWDTKKWYCSTLHLYSKFCKGNII